MAVHRSIRVLLIAALTALVLCLGPVLSWGQALDVSRVIQALGRTGETAPGDVYRVGFPRTDLQVTLDG